MSTTNLLYIKKMKQFITTTMMTCLLLAAGFFLTGCQRNDDIVDAVPRPMTQEDQEYLDYLKENTLTGAKSEDFGVYKEVVEYVMQSRSLPTERLKNIKISRVFGDITLLDIDDAGDGLGHIVLEMYQKGYDVDWVKEEPWYKKDKEAGSPYQIPDNKVQSDQISQRHYKWYATVNNHTVVKVFVANNVPYYWKNAIRGAVAEWNKVNGGLSFQVVNSYAYGRVKIYMSNMGYNANIARAEFPSNGKPGWRIRINTSHNGVPNMNGGNRRLLAMVHELGHTIGLNHTDNAVQANAHWQISPMNLGWGCNTPTPSSVMIAKISNNSNWSGFTYCDRMAYRTLYPEGSRI